MNKKLPTFAETMPSAQVSFQIYPSPGVRSFSLAQMHIGAMQGDFAHEADLIIGTSVPPALLVPNFMTVVRSSTSTCDRVVVAAASSGTLIVAAAEDRTEVQMWAVDVVAVGALWDEVARLAREFIDRRDQREIEISTWHDNVDGREPTRRSTYTAAEPWTQTRRNYPAATAKALDVLMEMERAPEIGGRLILWHGAPGTGKTNAVTSLIDSWRPGCDMHVITDPERFFGNPNYLMTVLHRRGQIDLDEPLPSMTERRRWRWKLIVCEDADEYIRSDARQRSGPALGRLLNAADGIIGRDSRSLILLTTNDQLGSLHPALTRPGRCLSAVDFTAMSRAEAAAWCPSDITPPAGPATLAELYALVRDGRQVPGRERVGFYV